MKKKEITFIIPYFGPPPAWMPFFLESCHANPDCTFLFFSDTMPEGTRQNVKVVRMTLADLKALAIARLEMPVSLENPYKVCDLRPAFGIIFDDYLKTSVFWGTCDVDMVLGNIRNFFPNELLSRYDVLSAKREYLVGHFTLFRNNRKINRLFLKSADYRQIFLSTRSFAFDECNFLWWKLLAGQSILRTQSQIDSMSHVVCRLAETGQIRAYFDSHVLEQDKLDAQGDLEALSEILVWDEGTLRDTETGREYLSFHFHFLKKEPSFAIPAWTATPGRFYISKDGFFRDAAF
ncbi:DUF6625 family protein [Dyadobacter crusticola]|uniref:DUF6625 family protein n=1 Tax=Dyadobacter crusticola TaxID=292407 RepID=UPI0012FB241F|nr:DUF6625 family protein [Dyadobacter crusticola]